MMWLALLGLAALAVAMLAAPWWWRAFAMRPTLPRRAANVAAYRGRLAELEADASARVLAPDAVDSAKDELAARLVDDAGAPAAQPLAGRTSRVVPWIIAGTLLAFGGAWYALAGSWRTQALITLSRTQPELARSISLDRSIERLREHVADHPDDAESWAWLGRAYRGRSSFVDAADAFARASALKGRQDPDLLVEEGEALAAAQDQAMPGAPEQRFKAALAVAPDHPRALWFAGLAALQAGDDRATVELWERLLRQPLPDDARTTLEQSVARVRERLGPDAPRAAVAGVVLRVEVSLAPALAADVQRGDTLFVFAQDPAGPPMPVAARRLSAADLPLQTTLDDGTSPMPARKLSSLDRWRIVARVSRSGSASPQPGDLEGSVEVGRADAGRPVQVLIDRRRP